MSERREIFRPVFQWVERAEHDLRTADHTLTIEDDCPFDTICFHAQQCVEKYMKACLVFNSIDFPKTHDLLILLKLMEKAHPLGLDLGEVQPLNRYSIEARYPGDWEPITRSEAEAAVSVARNVRDRVRGSLPEEALEK